MKYVDYIKKLDKCPFCEYDKHSILIENKWAYLTYSIAPYHKYHLLVVPKKHAESLKELSWDENVCIIALVVNALKALENLGHNDCNILGRDGEALSKSVKHFHFNIIPGGRIEDISLDASVRLMLNKKEEERLIKELKTLA